MRHVNCAQCGGESPVNDMFVVFGKSLCEACANEELSKHKASEIPKGAVVRQVDPTVCVRCQTDHDDEELPQLAGMPVCETCREFMRNRPFPTWIKSAFVVLIALAVFSFARNLRFFGAYQETLQANRAAEAGDIEGASKLFNSAAEKVPESQPLVFAAKMFRALCLMSEHKYAEALPLLRACKASALSNPSIERLLLQAECGVAFDNKDYDAFLAKAQAMMELDAKNSFAEASIASAYACKYAVTGNEEFKQKSLEHLEKARRICRKGDGTMQEYEDRIRHRLETREIISSEEYYRRFPEKHRKEDRKK